MENIIKGIYVGSDKDVAEAERRGFARLACCKDGPDSHRSMLGYTERSAPAGKNYLSVRKGDVMALNLIDVENPHLIPTEAIETGIKFITEMAKEGKTVLIHCNTGHSRSTVVTLLYLRSIGEFPQPINRAIRMFKTLYPPFSPGHGMECKLRELWDVVAPKG